MRVLIAHDESVYSEAAVNDLARAGLPRDTEVIVLSVVERKLVASQPSSLALFGGRRDAAETILATVNETIRSTSIEKIKTVCRHSRPCLNE